MKRGQAETMRTMLVAAVQLLDGVPGTEVASSLVAQVATDLLPSKGALRQRKYMGKDDASVTRKRVISDVISYAENASSQESCASRAASESLSSPKSSEIPEGEEKRDSEESESARAGGDAKNDALLTHPADARVTRKSASAPKPKQWRRVPADFVPTADAVTLATTLGVNLAAELEKFRDHEYAKPKTDVDAAFRTWLRNAAQWNSPARPANGQQRPVRGAMAPVSKSFEKPDWDAIAAEVKAS